MVTQSAAAPQLFPQANEPPPEIPPHLVERLAAAGVCSLTDWQRLSRRRKRGIFGITAAHQRLLDELSRAAA